MTDDPGRRAAADKMRAAGAHAEAIRAFESAYAQLEGEAGTPGREQGGIYGRLNHGVDARGRRPAVVPHAQLLAFDASVEA